MRRRPCDHSGFLRTSGANFVLDSSQVVMDERRILLLQANELLLNFVQLLVRHCVEIDEGGSFTCTANQGVVTASLGTDAGRLSYAQAAHEPFADLDGIAVGGANGRFGVDANSYERRPVAHQRPVYQTFEIVLVGSP